MQRRFLNLLGLVRKYVARLLRIAFRTLPTLGAIWLFKRLRIRFLPISHLDRIGHLALEPDCFLKDVALGRRPACRPWLLVRGGQRVANRCLLGYWKSRMTVIDSARAGGFLETLSAVRELRSEVHEYSVAIDGTAGFVAVQNAWQGRPALLTLSGRDRERGRDCLRALGMPEDAWFVGVHCREAGYVHDPIHDYRNASIDNYLMAIQAITARGGWCIRLGDPSMRPLPHLERVIDYPFSEYRSDWMDVFLCASARYVLGNTSGLQVVASVFGVPSACANLAPMSALSYGPDDLDICKLLYSRTDGRYLRFPEIFGSPIANFRFTQQYADAGLEVHESTPGDVRDLALEMLERCEGVFTCTAEDERLQARFKALMQPGHYSYGSVTRIGRDFLRKYRHLLD